MELTKDSVTQPTQKATLGRIVIYRVGQNDSDFLKSNGATHLPAIVVRDWGGCVNLKVFTDGNNEFWKTSVAQGDGEYCWQWPTRI